MRVFTEDADLAISLRDVSLIEATDSVAHRWQVLRHPKLGLALVMDGELQHVEGWQALYHEPLVHLAASFVPEVKRALVLGGGSLFAAREILRYPTIEKCILVDHDEEVLPLMERHYLHAREVLSDTRFEHMPADAVDFLSHSGAAFDLIINDSTDIVNTSDASAPVVLRSMSEALMPDGVCADVIYRHLFEKEYIAQTLDALRAQGSFVLSMVCVPEYPGTLHLLSIWASSSLDQNAERPRNKVQLEWMSGAVRELQFFDPNFLRFYLHLPPYLKALVTR